MTTITEALKQLKEDFEIEENYSSAGDDFVYNLFLDWPVEDAIEDVGDNTEDLVEYYVDLCDSIDVHLSKGQINVLRDEIEEGLEWLDSEVNEALKQEKTHLYSYITDPSGLEGEVEATDEEEAINKVMDICAEHGVCVSDELIDVALTSRGNLRDDDMFFEDYSANSYEEAVAERDRLQKLYEKKKAEIIALAPTLFYGKYPNQLKGRIKDLKIESKFVPGANDGRGASILFNTLTCESNDGEEFETTIGDLGYPTFKIEGYLRVPGKLGNYWGELVSLYRAYRERQAEANKLNPENQAVVKPTSRLWKRLFGPAEPGSAWDIIRKHPEWIKWIQDNVHQITAKAPAKYVKWARDQFGHDQIFPSNTWGLSFAISFKDADKCPFPELKELFSENGRLCSVDTVKALFKGPQYERLFTNIRDRELAPDEFEEITEPEEN